MANEFILSEDDRPPRELPKKGLTPAVLAFAEDLGMAIGFDGKKIQRKCVLIFEIGQAMADGRPFMMSKTYTASLWERAPFCKAVCALLGLDELTAAQRKAFRPQEMIGRQCMLNLIHETKNGKLKAKLDNVLPAMEGCALLRVQATEPPRWVETQRLANASEMARIAGGETPEDHDDDSGAAHGVVDEIPY